MEPNGAAVSMIVSTRSVESELQNRLTSAKIMPRVCISHDMHLRVFVGTGGFEIAADLPEGDFRLFQAIGRKGFAVSGGLRDWCFRSDLCVRVALECEPDVEPILHGFLADNIFGRFASVCRRRPRQGRLLFIARSRLGGPEYTDIRHELPTFVLRSGKEVRLKARCEIYDESGHLQCFGALPSLGQIGAARLVFDHPSESDRWVVRSNGTLGHVHRGQPNAKWT